MFVTFEVSNKGTVEMEEQLLNILFILVTFEVSNKGTVVRDRQSENMLYMLVTFEVSNKGTMVRDLQYWNICIILVTFVVSSNCQHPSKDVAVLYAHFPPASKKAFIDDTCFSTVFVTATFLLPKYIAIITTS